MNRGVANAWWVVSGLWLAGCATAPDLPPPEDIAARAAPIAAPEQPAPHPPAAKGTAVRDTQELESALAYFSDIRKRNGVELARDVAVARQAYGKSPSELNRIRLALLLALPGTQFRDERRAAELLEPMLKDLRAQYTPLRGFALVVHSFVAEQIKLGANAQTLKEKLDALRVLEKSITERANAGDTR